MYVGVFETLPVDFSPVDITRHNFQNYYPLMKDVPIKRVVLKPGNCIYIPAFWWTQTKTMSKNSRMIEFDYNPANELEATFMRNILAGQFVGN